MSPVTQSISKISSTCLINTESRICPTIPGDDPIKLNCTKVPRKEPPYLFILVSRWICLGIIVWTLGNGLSLKSSSVLARSALPISTPIAPKLYDTLRIIQHPQGVDQALIYLLSRSSQELNMMKTNALKKALSAIACPKLVQLNDSPQLIHRALQAITIFQRIGELGPEGECLKQLWQSTFTPRRIMYGHLKQDLLARSAIQTLHQIG